MAQGSIAMRALGYTGERIDAVTGTYPLGSGYRTYIPGLMRFSAPDCWSPFAAGGFNSYIYCEADPINRSDPTGHWSIGAAFSGFTKSASRYAAKLFGLTSAGDKIDAAMRDVGRRIAEEDSRFAKVATRRFRVMRNVRKLHPDWEIYVFESDMGWRGTEWDVIAHGGVSRSTGEPLLQVKPGMAWTGSEFAQNFRNIVGEDIVKTIPILNLMVCDSATEAQGVFAREVRDNLGIPVVGYVGDMWNWGVAVGVEPMNANYERLLESAKLGGATDPIATANVLFRDLYEGRKHHVDGPDPDTWDEEPSVPRFFPWFGG